MALFRCSSGDSGGGSSQPIDYSYLPSSTQGNVLASKRYENGTNIINSAVYADLGSNNVACTLYTYGFTTKTTSSNQGFLSANYGSSTGNRPAFFTKANGYNVYTTTYGSDGAVSGVMSNVAHVYAISLNQSTKKARFFVDGVMVIERGFSNSGQRPSAGAGDAYAGLECGGGFQVNYFGVVTECESDATIIANMQTIMSKMASS